MKKNFSEFNKLLGGSLMEARTALNIPLSSAASQVGISRQRLFNYENGERAMPMNIFIHLCELYDLDYLEVFKNAHEKLAEQISKINK